MDTCEYKSILTDVGVEIKGYEKNYWKPLMRQCMVASGVCCLHFIQGLFLGAPTVLVAQMRRDANTTEIVTDEMMSWLTSSPAITTVFFIIILPLLFNWRGRKLTFLLVCFCAFVGFIIFYTGTNFNHIVFCGFFIGSTFGAAMTITSVIIAEYTSPKYRGILSSSVGATAYWGIWISNAIGTFFHWKNIGIVALVCSVYLLSVLAWPESPYWLAKRRRFAEAAKSHRWLKGVNENSEMELAQLFNSMNSTNLLPSNKKALNCCSKLSTIWSIITSPAFYKPAIICLVLMSQNYFTGKLVIAMYAIQVLKRLSPDQSLVYKTMLILDGVTVFSMYMGCVISRYCKRRTVLFIFSGTAIAILFILSLYLYLASLSVITENDIVTVILLTLFSIAVGSGPTILSMSIYGEIIPPRYMGVAMICVGSCGIIIITLLLKFSPFMFEELKMAGSFLFYAISSSIMLLILYIYLPETKNKSIQEIEQYFEKRQRKEKLKEIEANLETQTLNSNNLM